MHSNLLLFVSSVINILRGWICPRAAQISLPRVHRSGRLPLRHCPVFLVGLVSLVLVHQVRATNVATYFYGTSGDNVADADYWALNWTITADASAVPGAYTFATMMNGGEAANCRFTVTVAADHTVSPNFVQPWPLAGRRGYQYTDQTVVFTAVLVDGPANYDAGGQVAGASVGRGAATLFGNRIYGYCSGGPCGHQSVGVPGTVSIVNPSTAPSHTRCVDDKSGGDGGCESCHGMARYSIHSMLVSLNLVDTPLSYSPPKGPSINFTATYNQLDAEQPATFAYSNLGPKWTFNWLSFVNDDPVTQLPQTLVYTSAGGADTHLFDSGSQTFLADPQSHAFLVRTGAASYEKDYPDGSKEIFGLSDGATAFPRRIFMTQKVDPAGNTITIGYDSSFRVTTITDALGQVTTLAYELTGDPLKITKVTDPFGSSATFDYVGGQLLRITDPVGIQSQFGYTTGTDSISSLTTPYGTTTFVTGQNGTNRWIETTDPLGGKERVEYREHAPGIASNDSPVPNASAIQNGGLDTGNTFFWDKRAMLLAPGDYTKAVITHWRPDVNGVLSGSVASKKKPLENRVWYGYADSPGSPSQIARVLDDGSTQLYQYEYNSYGKVTKTTDPIGRSTTFMYGLNNIDLLEVRQTTGSLDELLASYSYNGQHSPLTATDASGQTTTNTYYSSGQIHTVTNAKQETTTYSYDTTGYLQNVVGAVPGAITSFTYDSFGRLRTTTDSENYTVTTDYDAINNDPTKTLNRVAKVTYPDGTYEQTTYDRLDPEWTRDRLGRWSRKFYDALQHVVATQDPLNRIVIFDWCNCGSLDGLTDQNGNPTTWTRDIQGRIIDKIYADNTRIHYTFEATTSRLASTLDAKNQSANYQYFLDNNLKQVSYTNAEIATPTVSYTHDPNYNRIATMTDGTGVTTYGYNPVTTSILGAGKLASVDGPLADDTINYTYDELGRTTGQSINGAANASSMQFDSLGRVQSATNVLGAFGYSYVNSTSRVDHVDYPNGQKVQYAYFDNLGDQRLQQIKNLDPVAVVISQFDYTYDATGQIRTWTQANSGMANPKRYDFGYDVANQLRSASLTDTVTGAGVAQYGYDYDSAGNKTNEQTGSAITSSMANNLNQITSQSAGGKMHFRGSVNEPATVTVAGNPAAIDAAGNFDGVANVNVGNNTVSVTAVDTNGNSRTNNYQVTVPSGATKTLVYDLNGNLMSDGDKTYEWDAVNHLVAINYAATGNRSEFTYDGFSRRTKIVEKNNGGATLSTKSLIWIGTEMAEERDESNTVVKQYFAQGEQVNGVVYYYTRDHLGSVRELTDNVAAIQARYDYDPYGRRTKLTGGLDTDFGFTGLYHHALSDLHLAIYRVYSSTPGKWLSRDPLASGIPFLGLSPSRLKPRMGIGERFVGPNLYDYVDNDPIRQIDPLGLIAAAPNFTYICQGVDPAGNVRISLPPYKSSKCDREKADKCCQEALAAYDVYLDLVAAAGSQVGPIPSWFAARGAYFLALADFYTCMAANGF